ncbi:MAG: hypothetical protein INR72_15090 [Williamsia herbipolensis]|nr:hypothetical protein [Williamsia herbipolensis]
MASGPVAFGREARRPLAGGRRVADGVASVVLLVFESVVAVAAGWGIVFLTFRFDSCGAPGTRCDEALGGAVVAAGPVLVALLLVASIVVSVLRLVRRRLAWPVPVIGVVAIVAAFAAALAIVGAAVQHVF